MRFTAALLVKKICTGLTGVEPSPNPHHELNALYGKILRVLCKMPPDSQYRRYTEQIVNCRQAVLDQTCNVLEIERLINCGQAEDLIVQASEELHLARNFLIWRPWEELVCDPPKGQWDWPPNKPTEELKGK